MSKEYIFVKQSLNLNGIANLSGAKNAVLPIMAALILTNGKSELENVPESADVIQMINLLQDLGAKVLFDSEKKILNVDTSTINSFELKPEVMNKMRASILVMGSLLARFGQVKAALPGGCSIGKRPVDFHLQSFKKMRVEIQETGHFLIASLNFDLANKLDHKIVLEYPSVGATENVAMLAAGLPDSQTIIVNAALEPEVLDFLDVLRKMGAQVDILPPATIRIRGIKNLKPLKHKVIPDRLEAGSILLAAAITGGQVELPDARADHMDLFLEKLKEMGHEIIIGENDIGISFKAVQNPRAVSFKTGPYPGFPTDLQAPMMAVQCLAEGESLIEETVFENRFLHVKELQKMGADLQVIGSKVSVTGVKEFIGSNVLASDIRACAALALAGLAAKGSTEIRGVFHWRRGYDKLEDKLALLGGKIKITS